MLKSMEVEARDILIQRMSKLRINRQKISPAEQKGKYKKAFERLEGEVLEALNRVLDQEVFFFYVTPEHHVELRQYALQILTEAGFLTAIRNCDAEKILEMLPAIHDQLMTEIHRQEKDADFSSTERYSLNPFCTRKIVLKKEA